MSYSNSYTRSYTSGVPSGFSSSDYFGRSRISSPIISSYVSTYTSSRPSSGSGNYRAAFADRHGLSSGDDRVTWKPNQPRPVPEVDYWTLWSNQGEEESSESPEESKPDVRFKVLDVDLSKATNRAAHHTSEYEHTQLIVRRGQEFIVKVKVNKQFNKAEDIIKIQFVTGDQPRESRGTMFLVSPGDNIDVTSASAVIDSVDDADSGSTISLRLNFPCDAIVGKYTMCVRLYNKEDVGQVNKFSKYKMEETIIVLFNPWCKDDLVFLENETERKEYVMNQSGVIYVGVSTDPGPRAWIFGQFDNDSLDAALYVLNASMLPFEAYGNPVRVVRTISAMVNSNDYDKGILTGSWSGKYSGGTSPTAWNGSVRILEEYMRTKRAVKFGQCWVFSGVCTTVCRALGIPARSVTNFDSAHDRDISMTIDFHINESGDPIKRMNDSVWNFHVWNEAWFKRPDLPQGYDGWQAFDATPQEMSDNYMQCGPAPVKAVKEGDVHLSYDTKFLYGEVNGDCITWEVNAAEERTPVSVDDGYAGAKISTKALGKRERLDLTNDYKYPEGSSEERQVAMKVSQLSSRKKRLQELYNLKEKKDVEMVFTGVMKPNMDTDFNFKAVSSATEVRTVNATINIVAKYYTGVDGENLGKRKVQFILDPDKKEDEYQLTIKASDWLNKIDEDATVGVYVLGKVKETSQTYVYKKSYGVEKPQLAVETPSYTAAVRKPFDVTIKFTNPLETTLTNASLLIEGAGIKNERKIILGKSIRPGQEVTETVTLTPKMTGQREIIASFNSRQLVGIFGSTDIDIVED